MPQPVKMVYQGQGRKHVSYIYKLALRIWSDTYDCRNDNDGEYWRQSLKDALTIHRNYLKTGMKVRHPKYAVRVSPIPVPPKLKPRGLAAIPKTGGCFWKDPESGLWMPMLLN